VRLFPGADGGQPGTTALVQVTKATHVFGHPVAPEGTRVENPAFDVTPHRYVSAIITEKGVARAPYEE
jgi:methylthioribose-1-phosphate isomerase